MRVDRGGRWQKKPEMRQTAQKEERKKTHKKTQSKSKMQ